MQDAPEWAKAMANDLKELTTKVDGIDKKVASTDEKVADLTTVVAGLVTAVADLTRNVADLTREVAGLTRNVADLTREVAGLTRNVADLTMQVDGLTREVAGLTVQVGHLVGSEAERRAHANIINLASEHLSLRAVQVYQSQIIPMPEELQETISQAATDLKITDAQANELRKSDIIIYAFDRVNRERAYYTFEVSNTIGNGDITRAMSRAETLRAATGRPSYPAVIGAFIDQPQEDFAARNNVKVLRIPGATSLTTVMQKGITDGNI